MLSLYYTLHVSGWEVFDFFEENLCELQLFNLLFEFSVVDWMSVVQYDVLIRWYLLCVFHDTIVTRTDQTCHTLASAFCFRRWAF